jgi:hypothetical protein
VKKLENRVARASRPCSGEAGNQAFPPLFASEAGKMPAPLINFFSDQGNDGEGHHVSDSIL